MNVVSARYPPIGDYALVGNGRAAALISRDGSADWCCMPRLDSGSCFGRILDWDRGGHCSIAATAGDVTSTRGYLEDTLVLETRLAGASGEARILDCVTMDDGERWELLRIVEGTRGTMELDLHVAPRFDYGDLSPWIRSHGPGVYSATGGDDALVIAGDLELEADKHELASRFAVRAGERVRLSIAFMPPE